MIRCFQNQTCIVALGATLCLSVFASVTSAQTKTVSGNRANMTVNCAGMRVEIMGNSNVITLKGACGNVSVSGNSNKVTSTGMQKLDVSGNSNSVRTGKLRSASVMGNRNRVMWSKKANRQAPTVSNVGTGNTVLSAP